MPDLLLTAVVAITTLGVPHAAVLVKLTGIGGPAYLHDALGVEVNLMKKRNEFQYARATHTP